MILNLPRFDFGQDYPVVNFDPTTFELNVPNIPLPLVNFDSGILPMSQLNYQPDPLYYTILNGDTLNLIANRYGISVSDLARLNDIKDINKIGAGSRLRFEDYGDDVYEDTYNYRPRRQKRASNTQLKTNNRYNTVNKQKSEKIVEIPEVYVTAKKKTQNNKKLSTQYIPYQASSTRTNNLNTKTSTNNSLLKTKSSFSTKRPLKKRVNYNSTNSNTSKVKKQALTEDLKMNNYKEYLNNLNLKKTRTDKSEKQINAFKNTKGGFLTKLRAMFNV